MIKHIIALDYQRTFENDYCHGTTTCNKLQYCTKHANRQNYNIIVLWSLLITRSIIQTTNKGQSSGNLSN